MTPDRVTLQRVPSLRLFAAAAAVVLTLTACGSSSDAAQSPTAEPTAEAAANAAVLPTVDAAVSTEPTTVTESASATPTPVIDQAAIDALTTQTAAQATTAAVNAMGTPNAPQSAPAEAPLGGDGQPAAAIVNGQIITRTEYERASTRFRAQTGIMDAAELRGMVLNMLIEQALIEQAAAGQLLTVPQDLLDQEVQNAQQLAGSPDAWAAWLQQNQYTEAEFRETLADALLTGLMRDAVTQDLNGQWLQANARHILVGTETEAEAIIARLNAGEDFAALAAQNSLDITTRDAGGDLGWFLPGELIELSLDQAAFQSEIGQVIGPLQSSLGYHVLQVIAREQRSVDDDRRAILAQTRFEDWLNSLTAAAVIAIYV